MKLVLGVDPATSCGVALLDMATGDLVEAATIKSNGETWGAKLNDMGDQFTEVFGEHFQDIAHIVYERNSKFASDLLTLFVGRIAQELPGVTINEKRHGVNNATWKKWVRRESGVAIKDPKGVEALEMVRPGWGEDLDDDAADAILVALTWLDGRKK